MKHIDTKHFGKSTFGEMEDRLLLFTSYAKNKGKKKILKWSFLTFFLCFSLVFEISL